MLDLRLYTHKEIGIILIVGQPGLDRIWSISDAHWNFVYLNKGYPSQENESRILKPSVRTVRGCMINQQYLELNAAGLRDFMKIFGIYKDFKWRCFCFIFPMPSLQLKQFYCRQSNLNQKEIH